MTTKTKLSLIIPVDVADGRLAPTDGQRAAIQTFLRDRRQPQVQVEFTQPRLARSKKANAYYWAVVLKTISEETGHTSEEIHEYFKTELLPRKWVGIGGREREVPKSTTELTMPEFSEYLERVRAWAAQELKMTIPLPGGELP